MSMLYEIRRRQESLAGGEKDEYTSADNAKDKMFKKYLHEKGFTSDSVPMMINYPTVGPETGWLKKLMLSTVYTEKRHNAILRNSANNEKLSGADGSLRVEGRPGVEALLKVWFVVSEPWTLYVIFYVLLSLSAIVTRNFFLYAFHLTEIILFETTLLRKNLAFISSKSKILLQTFFLWFLIIFWYTIIGFVYFRTDYLEYDEDDHSIISAQHCRSVVECLFFTLDNGIRIGEGIGELLDQNTKEWGSSIYFDRFFFDVSYFLFVSVILLSIVSGIIIDAFGNMRDVLHTVQSTIAKVDIFAGIEREKLPRYYHQGRRGNAINAQQYIHYFIHLYLKQSSEFDGSEQYIYDCISKRFDPEYADESVSFFPATAINMLEEESDE